MIKLTFTPFIDLPLVALSALAFICYVNEWAHRHDQGAQLSVTARLPAARLRIAQLFAGVLLLCWSLNLAVWFVFALLLGVGFAMAIVLSMATELGGDFLFSGTVYLIREWAFGFPELVLQSPIRDSESTTHAENLTALVGKIGVTTSPLRPLGDAEFEGVKHSVVSEDQEWVDAGLVVKAVGIRNGLLCVIPMPEASAVAG